MAKALVTIGATSQEVDIKVGQWGDTAAASVGTCVHSTAAGQVLLPTALRLLQQGACSRVCSETRGGVIARLFAPVCVMPLLTCAGVCCRPGEAVQQPAGH